MCCAIENDGERSSDRSGTSVALRFADARDHAAFVDMDPLVEPESWEYHLVNKEHLPRKASPFAQTN
jgi:hypothetical protein